ncbi:MAG: glycosyltransferase [Candidatus Dormibacteria bacterium]
MIAGGLPKVLVAAMAAQVVLALCLMPVSGQPYDLAALTGASEAWMRWGFPLLYHWKFGFDLTALGIGAQGLRFALESFGMSGAAALATAWKVPLVLANLLTAVTLLDLGRRLKVRHPLIMPTVWLLCPPVLWVAAGHGQVEPLDVLAFVLALDLMVRRHFGLAGLVVGLGIGIEFLPAVLVPVAGLWFLGRLMRRRDLLRYGVGLVIGLLLCFGPTLASAVARSSLVSGLMSTALVTTGSTGGGAVQPTVGASLWVVFGITPGRFWVVAAVSVIGAVFLLAARRVRHQGSEVECQRVGIVAAGSFLLAIVLLDPGALPQFTQLTVAGLCVVGMVVGLNPAVIVVGPALQLLGGFLKVYGGSFQSYWYDMWFRSGNGGWTFPQNAVLANLAYRFGTFIIVIGLVWIIVRLVVNTLSTNSAGPPSRRLASAGKIALAGSAAAGILGSAFLAGWSLQPTFWSGVGSTRLQSLVDFKIETASRPFAVEHAGSTTRVIVPRVLEEAAHEAKVPPSLTLDVQAHALLVHTATGSPHPTSAGGAIETLTRWSAERADVKSLWISVLVGRPDWTSPADVGKNPPLLVDGDREAPPSEISWATPGWSILTYAVPRNWVAASGDLSLSVQGSGPSNRKLTWNGSARHRWMVVNLRSGVARLAVGGKTYRRTVSVPSPRVGTFARDEATVSNLPATAHTTAREVSLGGSPGKVMDAALTWPLNSPLDTALPGFALFSLGELDLVLLLGGGLALLAWLGSGNAAARRRRNSERVGATPARVLIATRYSLDRPGGVERAARAIAEGLAQRTADWRVQSVVGYSRRTVAARIPLAGDAVAAAKFAAAAIRGVDVVMVHGAEYAWAPLLVAKFRGRPTVVVWHGVRGHASMPSSGNRLTRALQELFLRVDSVLQRVALLSDEVVAVSPTVAAELRSRYGYRKPIQVILNPVRSGSRGSRARVRRRGQSALRVIWVGTTAYKKGLDLALQACERARERGVELTLTVVGVGAEAAPAPYGGTLEWVSWEGMVDPSVVDTMIAHHDLMLSPTRYEPFGMAVFEALGSGLPVIGSQALEWQIGAAGEVVHSDNPEDYAAALARASDPQRLAELRQLALKRAEWVNSASPISSYAAVLIRALSHSGRDSPELRAGVGQDPVQSPAESPVVGPRATAANHPPRPPLADNPMGNG